MRQMLIILILSLASLIVLVPHFRLGFTIGTGVGLNSLQTKIEGTQSRAIKGEISISQPLVLIMNVLMGVLEMSGVVHIKIRPINTDDHSNQYALNLRRSEEAQSDPLAAVTDDSDTR